MPLPIPPTPDALIDIQPTCGDQHAVNARIQAALINMQQQLDRHDASIEEVEQAVKRHLAKLDAKLDAKLNKQLKGMGALGLCMTFCVGVASDLIPWPFAEDAQDCASKLLFVLMIPKFALDYVLA